MFESQSDAGVFIRQMDCARVYAINERLMKSTTASESICPLVRGEPGIL